jgi:1,4-dihydroxy-2-naphthoate octaprenyltransferase
MNKLNRGESLASAAQQDHIKYGQSLWRAFVHLRLPFSLVLSPLFVWGIYLAPAVRAGAPLPWAHILLAYLVVHVPLYGGMNAFNSYYDRDDGPIGSLAAPPPVDRAVLVVAWACKALALAAGLWLDPRFGLLVAAAIGFSVVYSHPRWRWKERPALAAFSVFAFQGVLGVLWGYTAATWAPGQALPFASIWPTGWAAAAGVLGAAAWTLGFYPLTGVYQISNDEPRGVRTLAVALGVAGCFLVAALVAPLGGLGVWLAMLARGAYLAMAASALYMAGAALYVWRWYGVFRSATPRENQRTLMRLSYANGLVFTLVFLELVLGG